MATELDLTPRKRPRQARSKATVDAILTATAQTLVELGYDKTTTNLVAQRAGVSIGSLYQYFPNKEALVKALCEQHMQQTLQRLMGQLQALRTQPLPDAVRSLVHTLLQVHAMEPELHRVLIQQVPRLDGLSLLQQLDRIIIDVIREGLEQRPEQLRPKDLDLATFILVHSVQAVTHAAVLERPDALDDEGLADETVALVLRYLM